MKVTADQLVELAQAAGLDVQIVEKAEDSDYNKDAALQAVDSSRKEIIKPQIESEIKDELKKWTAGETGFKLRQTLAKKIGIPQKELEGLADGEAIDKALEYKLGTLDTDKKQMQEEVQKLLNEHNITLESIKAEYENQLKGEKEKFQRRDMVDYLESQLKDAPLPKNADRRVIAEDLLEQLGKEATLKYDEAKRSIDLFEKDKPDMPLLNDTKTASVKIIERAKPFLEKRGIWQTDMRNENPKDALKDVGKGYQPPNQTQNPPTDVTPQQREIQRRAAIYEQAQQPA